nr:hypothetical protein [Tanacetum cinerariifolium]
MDLKWQMAMLSVRVHKFEQKDGRKIDFDKKESARFNKKKVRCYKCQQRGHFARECMAKGNDKQRYSSFKIKEIKKKEEDSKALITVDTLVDWTYHDSESDGVIAAKEFGMIAGCDSENAIKEGATKIYNLITGADTEEASTADDAGEFALMGVTFKVHNCPFGCDNKINADVETAKKELQTKLDNHLVQTEKWRNSSKNMFRLIDSSMSVRTKMGLGFNNCIRENKLGWNDSAFSVFTTKFEDVEGRPLFHRFAKSNSMKAMPPHLFEDYTSLSDHSDLDESQMSYGTKSSTSSDSKSVSNDFVSYDDSDKSSEVNTNNFASSDSSVKSLEPKPNDSTSCASISSVSTSENETEIESKPIIVQDLPSFSCNSSDKNENTSRTSCNKNGYSNKKADHFRKHASSVSKLCFVCGSGTHLIKDCDFYEKQMVNMTVGIGVTIPPTRPQPVPTGKPKVFAPVSAGRQNRPFPVPTDRGYSPSVSSGWWKSTAKPMPYFKSPFLDAEEEGIFDSGCSQSMTGNKERLDDFQAFQGGKVTFRGVKICDKKNRVLFTDTECLVLSKDFKLPDESMVVFFLEHKDATYPILRDFINLVENQFNKKVKAIRCDNGKKFKNAHMIELCGSKGIMREYSNARTPQQNGVAERKNRTLIEEARTMLADSKLPTMFWTEAVKTTCYVLNRVLVTSPHNKIPYALLTGNIPSISHFKPFGCYVTILNTSDHLGKFDGKADEGYIVRYSASNKAYRVYNMPNKRVEETMNLRFLKEKPNVQGLGHEWYFDLDYLTDTLGYKHVQANQSAGTQGATTNYAGTHDVDLDSNCDEQVIIVPSYPSHSIQGTEPKDTSSDAVDDSLLNFADEIFQKELARLKGQEQKATSNAESLVPTGYIPDPAGATMVSTNDVPVYTSSSTNSFFDDEPTTRFSYPSDLGNHDPSPGIFSSSSYDDKFGAALNNVTFTVEALKDPSWVDTMQEEMQQFKFQNVWVFVDLPAGKYAIGTKWILKNKRDDRGIVVQNKTRLVAQGHRQEEGIYYDEVFALIARIKAIRLFLAFASYMGFMVYQMDVKSAFLYGIINEEVYVTQPKGFVDPQHPKTVYKVVKALYGLHQSPRAWYATISTFLLKHGYRIRTIDKTLFLKKNNRDIIMVQVYVDDIIFGSTKKTWCLQVQQKPDGIFINQDKYVQEILNKFDLGSVRTATTPYEAPKHKSMTESDSPVNVHLYRSMIGLLMYLTASRPDIMFAVSACSRNQVTHTTSNLEAVKKIFKYLKGQPKLGLWYPRESPFVLEAYSDSDYAGANKDRKSTTGGCQFLGRRLISWQCKKQTIVATSSTKADLMIQEGGLGIFECSTWTRWPYFGDNVFILVVQVFLLVLPEFLLGMVSNIGNAKKFLMYLRFLQAILGIETTIKRQYKVLMFSSRLFANMRLNFKGHPMPLLPAMLLQAPTGEDEPLGGSFHMSPPRSTQAPPAGQPSGGAEDPITLTALSSVVSTLVQKVNSLETKLKDHKKLFKDVVGKLVKKVKSLEVKLMTKKRKMVVSDSDQDEGRKQDVDLDALRALANASVTVDSNIPPGGASNTPTAVPTSASAVPTGDLSIPTGSLSVPTNVPPSVAPAGVSNKGKSSMMEEDIPVKARKFKQMQEDILGEQAAKRKIGSTSWLRLRLMHLSPRHCWERRNRPMTQAQQRTYMRQFVKNQSCVVYSTGWSMARVKSFIDAQLKEEFEKIQKAISNTQIQVFSWTLKRTGPMRKSLSRKRLTKPKSTLQELDLDVDAQTSIKVVSTEDFDDEAPPVWSALVGWEVIPTPLGDINTLYRIDQSTKIFTTLRHILHMVDRRDLVKLYGLVVQYYKTHHVAGAGFILWG